MKVENHKYKVIQQDNSEFWRDYPSLPTPETAPDFMRDDLIALSSSAFKFVGNDEDVHTAEELMHYEHRVYWEMQDDERYLIIPEPRIGGSSAVFKAWDKKFGRIVAVKVPISNDYEFYKFARTSIEALRLGHLDDKGIVKVDDFMVVDRKGMSSLYSTIYKQLDLKGREYNKTSNEVPVLIEEWVEGRSLLDIFSVEHNVGSTHLDKIAEIVFQVAQTIDKQIASGIVHGDLKPGNILVTPVLNKRHQKEGGFQTKLVDYGLADFIGDKSVIIIKARIKDGDDDDVWKLMGSFQTMSIEKFHTHKTTVYEDIYGLGATAYWMLTGSFPGQLDGEKDPRKMIKNRLYHPESVQITNEMLSNTGLEADADTIAELNQIFAKCLYMRYDEKEQKYVSLKMADRYQSAEAFADTISFILGNIRKLSDNDELPSK